MNQTSTNTSDSSRAHVIPEINLASTPSEFVDSVGRAFHDVGFFRIMNHGLDSTLIRDAYRSAQDFFDLPAKAKNQYVSMRSMTQPRGYMILTPRLPKDENESLHAKHKEMWHFRPEWSNYPPLHSQEFEKNFWPREIPNFSERIGEVCQKLGQVAEAVFGACAHYLGVDRSAFLKATLSGPSLFRVIHYPPATAPEADDDVRFDAHEDLSLITVMIEPNAAGLEIQGADGIWRQADIGGGGILVNTGELLQRLSNGLFRSAPHRVITPAELRKQSRISMPLFVIPDQDFSLTPSPEALKYTGGKPNYSAITAGEYLAKRVPELPLY